MYYIHITVLQLNKSLVAGTQNDEIEKLQTVISELKIGKERACRDLQDTLKVHCTVLLVYNMVHVQCNVEIHVSSVPLLLERRHTFQDNLLMTTYHDVTAHFR